MISIVNTKIKKFEIPVDDVSIEDLAIRSHSRKFYTYSLFSGGDKYEIKEFPRNQLNPISTFKTLEELFCWYVASLILEATTFPPTDPDFRVFGTYISFKFTNTPTFFRVADNFKINDIEEKIEEIRLCCVRGVNPDLLSIAGIGVKASGIFGISIYYREQGSKKLIDSDYMNYLTSDSYDW